MLNLTATEEKVVHLITLGFSEKEIAGKLFIETSTVHTHARNIRRKMGARNAVDIARNYILSLENPKKILIAIGFLFLEIISLGADVVPDDVRVVRSSKPGRSVNVKSKTNSRYELDTFII